MHNFSEHLLENPARYMYVCICVYVYMYVCMYVCMYVYMCMYVCVYVCKYWCVGIRLCPTDPSRLLTSTIPEHMVSNLEKPSWYLLHLVDPTYCILLYLI